MKTWQTIFALCFIGLSACRNTDAGDAAADRVTTAMATLSEDELLAKVYDNSYQVPDNFYIDERANTPRSYTVYHVKDVSVSYELCTDDYGQALAWEALDSESRAVNGDFVGSYENDRYFEFIRELSYPDSVGNISDPTSPGFARVFKCSYVNRDGVDRTRRDGYAGILNMGPLTPDVVATYTEYMWQFTFFWPARKKVLEAYSAENNNGYQHTLALAFLTNQGVDKCDLIEIVDWVFTVDRNTGQITKDFRLVYQMEAQLLDGTPTRCET